MKKKKKKKRIGYKRKIIFKNSKLNAPGTIMTINISLVFFSYNFTLALLNNAYTCII